jgi:replicative DNA helicase
LPRKGHLENRGIKVNATIEFSRLEDATAPPFSIESEASVLGALLLDNGVWDRIADRLKASDFYNNEHRLVFGAISELINASKAADVVTVFEHLRSQGKAEQAGGLAHINGLAQYVPSAANVHRYAEVVRERSLSRQLMAVSNDVRDLAADSSRSFDERVALATSLIAKLIDSAPRDEWVSAYDGMVSHLHVIQDRADGKTKAMPTGLHDLDEVLEGGVRPGELIIVGARPAMGKTALAMTIGLNLAHGHSVGMLSMEMPHLELRDRMTAMMGRVNLSSVKRPNRGGGLDYSRVLDSVERARRLKFYACDQGGLNINQVRSKARNLKRLHGISVLLVDYIGLMNGTDMRQPRAYQLEEISRGLKALAKELEIAVICLAQVNRKVEERADSTPNLSDLRDSGAIEQDADVVMFVHRPIQAQPDCGAKFEHYAKLTVAKNRNGRCGLVDLFYQGEQTGFDSWTGPVPSTRSAGR